MLECWSAKYPNPAAGLQKNTTMKNNILVTDLKNKGGEFYHISFPPSKKFDALADLPKEVVFSDGDVDVPGILLDLDYYKILDLPHDLIRQVTGLGNAMWIASMITKHPGRISSDTKMAVWKCRIR